MTGTEPNGLFSQKSTLADRERNPLLQASGKLSGLSIIICPRCERSKLLCEQRDTKTFVPGWSSVSLCGNEGTGSGCCPIEWVLPGREAIGSSALGKGLLRLPGEGRHQGLVHPSPSQSCSLVSED